MSLTETWRWFGPDDPVTLRAVRETGVGHVVHSLGDFTPGTPWPVDAIAARVEILRAAGLAWHVIESLPVSDMIKRNGPDVQAHLDAWEQSLHTIAAVPGAPKVMVYNFMPVVDWTRTVLDMPLADGRRTLGFDAAVLAEFETRMQIGDLSRGGGGQSTHAVRPRHTVDDPLGAIVSAGLPGGQHTRRCCQTNSNQSQLG